MLLLKAVWAKLNAWRRYREAVRELSQLSDHELCNIGIDRGDVETIARRPAPRKPANRSQMAGKPKRQQHDHARGDWPLS